MKTIDIQTTQNVTINYEVAFLRERIFAFILDYLILGIVSGILGFLIVVAFGKSNLEDEMSMIILIPIISFYTLAFESLNRGQTIGKMALGIRVVKLNGKPLNFYDHLLRWSFRFIDLWLSMGTLAAMLSSTTDKGQRMGDFVANATVVRNRPSFFVHLKDLLKMETKSDHIVTYPQVKHFREEDMLIIKRTLERYMRHRNKAHEEAMKALITRVRDKLKEHNGLEGAPDQVGTEFLKTVIKDYVVLTR